MKKHIIIILLLPVFMVISFLIIFSCGEEGKDIDHIISDNIDNNLPDNTTIDDTEGNQNDDETPIEDNRENDEEDIEIVGNDDDSNGDEDYNISIDKLRGKKYINAYSGLNMRESPGLDGEVILSIPYNSEVEVISTRDEVLEIDSKTGVWVRITYKNQIGWVFSGYLMEEPMEVNTAKGYAYITAESGLRMRQTPALDSDVVVKIPYKSRVETLSEMGNTITIEGVDGRWTKITWNEYTGWVFGGYLGNRESANASWLKMLDKGTVYDVIQTTDRGFVSAGTNDDFVIIRMDSAGDLIWRKTFGGLDYDTATSIKQTSDGGFIVAGISVSDDIIPTIGNNSEVNDFYIVKLNSNGDKEWDAMYFGSGEDGQTSIMETEDGGYIMAGTFWLDDYTPFKGVNTGRRDFYLLKLDSTGKKEWDAIYGGSDWDEINSQIIQTLDGGYILAGYSMSQEIKPANGKNNVFISGSMGSTGDMYIMKVNASGDMEWDAMYGGSGMDWANSVTKTKDGGYLIGGMSNSSDVTPDKGINRTVTPELNINYDYYVVKISSDGEKQWSGMYGGSSDDNIYSINSSQDGGYILLGETKSSDINITRNSEKDSIVVSDSMMLAMKLDAEGITEWTFAFGEDAYSRGYSIIQTKDAGFMLGGNCNDGYLCFIKLRNNGTLNSN
jgi:uncharacterized protein YgiM (DUF1202 family)